MAIPTSRTKERATIFINADKCTGCGKCVSVCKDFSLRLENNKVKISNFSVFGCIGCGHCMAICPEGAIEISGIKHASREGLFVVFGYPAVHYKKGIKRTFASTTRMY